MRPLIGITSDTGESRTPANRRHKYYWIKEDLPASVREAGGIPAMLHNIATPAEAKQTMERLDGLLVSGGNFDITPEMYGEKRRKVTATIKEERTDSETLLLKAALKTGKPVLGVCGGQQLINVLFGGTLYQDIRQDIPNAKKHEQAGHPSKPSHAVSVMPGTLLRRITGQPRMRVNSTHHQAVKDIGKGLTACALSADGIVEAVEGTKETFLLGVQWHPEFLYHRPEQAKIFKRFIKECKK